MKLALPALLVLVACGGKATPPPVANQGGGGGTAVGIRSIDWANRTYQNGDGTFTVKDGTFEFAFDENGNEVAADYQPTDPDGYVERGYFNVAAPVYGDVDGDGTEEAIIISVHNTGGTGQFDGADVYTMRGGEPVVIGGIPGGDRGDGGLHGVTFEGPVVIVERMMSQDGDGACCPSKLQVERWRWTGGTLVEDEAARTLIVLEGR